MQADVAESPARTAQAVASALRPPAETRTPSSEMRLFAIGLITLLGQVVLLREVLVASFGSELIYLLGIGVLMLGSAAGAAAAGRFKATDERIAALFIAFAVLIPLAVAFARSERVIFRGTPGAYLPFLQQLAGIAIVLLPAGMSGGALFAGTARLFAARSGTLATAYAIESAGGLAGGVLATVLIAAGAQNFTAAVTCSLLAAAAALTCLHSRRRTAVGVAALAVIAAAVFGVAPRVDRGLNAINHPLLLASADTPYGRATVSGASGQVAVFVNDALAYESQGTSAEEFVHLAALQCERPDSVLILGGAVEGLIGEVRKHHPATLHDVEIDRRLLALARPHLSDAVQRQFDEAGLIKIGDPRKFLQQQQLQYDLILSAMPEPDSGQASRFYTREFFDLCSRRLTPRGVLAFRLHSSENLWTPALARRTSSIVTAVRSVFRDSIVLPGAVNIIVASNARLERDPDVLSARFVARGIAARLVSPRYVRYVMTNDRAVEVERILAETKAAESRDARPVCYHYTLLLWLSRFFPGLARLDASVAGLRAIAAAIVLATFVMAWAFRRSRRRRYLLVMFAGFAGVVLEAALIVAYQIREGVLYQDLGILLAAFMAGLSGGAWLVARRLNRPAPMRGFALLLAAAATAAVTASTIFSAAGGLMTCALLLAGAGLVTGAIFANASGGVEDREIAPLCGADLSGGVAGSLAASLVLIPLAGLPATVMLVGVLALAVLPLTLAIES